MQPYLRKSTVRPLALLAACCLLPGQLLASSANYLNALEAEADNISATETTPNQPTTDTATSAAPAVPAGEILPAGLSQADFEETLKSSYFGSYIFYSKLSDGGKTSVYKEYQKNGSINHLREVIKTELTK